MTHFTRRSFSIIVAVDQKNGISKDGKIPWRYPEDMQNFVNQTRNGILIMGRKTYEFIGRPLKNRRTIVVSTTLPATKDIVDDKTIPVYCSDLDSAFRVCERYPRETVWICGGRQIYQQIFNEYMGWCDDIYITRIDKTTSVITSSISVDWTH